VGRKTLTQSVNHVGWDLWHAVKNRISWWLTSNWMIVLVLFFNHLIHSALEKSLNMIELKFRI